MTATGNPWGVAVSAVSSIGSSIWGDVDGEDEYEKAKKVNEEQVKVNKQLATYKEQMDYVYSRVEDTASSWSKFWGGADYEAIGLDKAVDNLEKMKEKLAGLKVTFSTLIDSFAQGLKDATSYGEFE
jgi:hypothetical protein